jgi:hypothetical protein
MKRIPASIIDGPQFKSQFPATNIELHEQVYLMMVIYNG